MKKQFPGKKMHCRWPWILLVQSAATIAVFCLLSLSLWLGGFIHGLFLWVLTPVAGFISACIATRAGLLNYAAWLIPPLAQIAASMILWGYPANVGPVFLCAFISLVGAATGEVLKRSTKHKGVLPWKKT